jgi:hypothetical protein
MIRAQYHFRPSADGLLAWDVRRLVELSRGLTERRIRLASIRELDENHWYAYDGQVPTCRSIIEHARLIDEADLGYPIILDADGRVMDGMHRVCKAVLDGDTHINAVRFAETPLPDYVGRQPDDLPYD